MARYFACKVYFTPNANVGNPIPPKENWMFIENRLIYLPELVNQSANQHRVVNNDVADMSGINALLQDIPDAGVLSSFYNWDVSPHSVIFDLFPQFHNYYPIYVTYGILYEIYNIDNTIYGYLYNSGGSGTNYYTAFLGPNLEYYGGVTNFSACHYAPLITTNENGVITAIHGVTFNGVISADVYVKYIVPYGDVSTFITFLNNINYNPQEDTDPYSWAGHSHTSGKIPEEQHEIVQNDVGFPSLPTAAAINAGFVSVWVPQLFQVQNLANYMWNINLLSADFWKKLVASPLELIYGLSIIPYDFRSAESEYQVHTDNLTLGYVNTKLSMDYIEEQFIDVDMGELDMKEWAGAYLDYDPQTRISIYLPYIGVKDLNADDIMNKVLSLKYRIDLASGACIAMLKCTGTDEIAGEVDSVFYSFPGTCAVSIPVSASQQQELLRSIVSLGIGVTATVATVVGGVTAMGAATAVGATANGALGLKSHYAHSGAMGSSPGFMGVQTPYLIINRPRLAIPEDQNVYMGYPSFITETLGDLSGYTEVEVTHLDRLPCTEEEMSEIAELLKKGVFL